MFVGNFFFNRPRSIENFTGFPTAPWIFSGKFFSSSYGRNTDFATHLREGCGGCGSGGGVGAAKKSAKTEKNRKKYFPQIDPKSFPDDCLICLEVGNAFFGFLCAPFGVHLEFRGVCFGVFPGMLVGPADAPKTEKNRKT